MPSHRPHVTQVRLIAPMASQGSGAPCFGRAVTRQVKALDTRFRHRSALRLVRLADVSTEASAKHWALPSLAAPYIVSSPKTRPIDHGSAQVETLSLRHLAARRTFYPWAER